MTISRVTSKSSSTSYYSCIGADDENVPVVDVEELARSVVSAGLEQASLRVRMEGLAERLLDRRASLTTGVYSRSGRGSRVESRLPSSAHLRLLRHVNKFSDDNDFSPLLFVLVVTVTMVCFYLTVLLLISDVIARLPETCAFTQLLVLDY